MSCSTYSGLNGNHTAAGKVASHAQVSEELVLILVVGVTTSVMGVHAEIVAQTMRQEGSACTGLEDLILVSLQNTDGEETINGNLVSEQMHVIPQNTLLEHCYAIILHLENNLVDLTRLLGKLARQGKGSGLGNVRSVSTQACTGSLTISAA
jgi:hypothetical protein